MSLDVVLRQLGEILSEPSLLSDADFEWLVDWARQRRQKTAMSNQRIGTGNRGVAP